jgi:hypothetical protein
MLSLAKTVQVLHWLAVVAIPLFLVGTSSGWEAFIAIPIAAVAFLALLVGPIIAAVSARVKAHGTVSAWYAILTVAMWIASFGFPLSQEHSGDTTSDPSFLETLGLNTAANHVIGLSSLIACVLLWVATIVALVAMPDIPAVADGAHPAGIAPESAPDAVPTREPSS